MSDYFVTQFTESLPKILILGENNSLASQIGFLLEQQGFNIEKISYLNLLTGKNLQTDFQEHTYYKIILLFDLSQSHTAKAVQLSELLKNRREPLLIVCRFDTVPDSQSPDFSAWRADCQQQYQDLIHFAQILPKASLLITRDLILVDSPPPSAFFFIFKNYNQGQLTNPQLEFSFISQENFLAQAQDVFFAPYSGQKNLFQADFLPPAKFIRSILKEFDFEPKVTVNASPVADFEFPFPHNLIHGVPDLDFFCEKFFRTLLLPPQPKINKQKISSVFNPSTPAKNKKKDSTTDNLPPLPPPPTPAIPQTKTPENSNELALGVQSKKILAATKKVLSNQEEKFLSQYSQTLNPPTAIIYRRLDFPNFNFLICAYRPRPNISAMPSSLSNLKIPQLRPTQLVFPTQIKPFKNHLLNPLLETPISQAQTSHLNSPDPIFPITPIIAKVTQSEVKRVSPLPPIKHSSSRPPRVIFSRHAALRQKKIVIGAIITATLSLGLFFFLIMPHFDVVNNETVLNSYFDSCLDNLECLSSGSQINKSSFLTFKTSSIQDFSATLNSFSNQYNRLNKQLNSYYEISFKNQTGDIANELKIINQSLERTLADLDKLKTLFKQNQNLFIEFSNSKSLNAFLEALSNDEKKLNSLEKNLPLLEALALPTTLKTSTLVLNNQVARSGGGQVVAVINDELNQGKLTQPQFLSSMEILQAPGITVSTPELLQNRNEINNQGFSNLTFAQDFSAAATSAAEVLSSNFNYPTELLIGLNLSTLKEIQTFFREDSSILESYNDNQDSLLLSSLEKTWTNLQNLSEDKTSSFIYFFLDKLDRQDLQIFSLNPEIKTILERLGYIDIANNLRCPSSLSSGPCYLDILKQNDDYLALNSDLVQLATHNVLLSPTSTSHSRTITFNNTQGKEAALDYLSFVLPNGAQLDSFIVNGKVSTLDQNNSYIIRVEPGSTTQVKLDFSIDRVINKSDFVYSFYNQSQNGLLDQKLEVNIQNHLPYNPKIIAPSAITDNKNINFMVPQQQSFLGAVSF